MTYKTYEVRVYDNGEKHWFQHGKLHREDGPAREDADGKAWYQHGKLHREDGPAVEQSDGTKCWYQHGKLHREDGPAVEYANGCKAWHLGNKRLSEQEFNQRMSSCDGKVVMIDGKEYKLQEVK